VWISFLAVKKKRCTMKELSSMPGSENAIKATRFRSSCYKQTELRQRSSLNHSIARLP